jgi:hypothetical protein
MFKGRAKGVLYLAAGDVPLAVLHVLQVWHALTANHLQRNPPKFSPDFPTTPGFRGGKERAALAPCCVIHTCGHFLPYAAHESACLCFAHLPSAQLTNNGGTKYYYTMQARSENSPPCTASRRRSALPTKSCKPWSWGWSIPFPCCIRQSSSASCKGPAVAWRTSASAMAWWCVGGEDG